MTIHKSISVFEHGFVVDIICDSSTHENVMFSPYELSRNNVRGHMVKSVKGYNLDGTGSSTTIISSENDYVYIASQKFTIAPFYLGRGELSISAFFPTPARRRFVFYYDIQPALVSDI